jgi:hypothetical protein
MYVKVIAFKGYSFCITLGLIKKTVLNQGRKQNMIYEYRVLLFLIQN